jgi:uncharacterized membrane protein
MDVSIFLAKFWGWYMILFFLILTFNPKRIRQIYNDLNDQKFLILASFIAIIIGLLNILFHNIWTTDYRIIITLIGWAALIKGLILFTFPQKIIKLTNNPKMKLVQIVYVIFFLIGVYLLNVGYHLVPFDGY